MGDAARETGTAFLPKFDERGLIVAIVQDADNGEVLMVGYMNAETLHETMESGHVVFWSRSRNQRWKKGETSGHVLRLREIYTDCDQDALVVKATCDAGVCHVGFRSCFYRKLDADSRDTLQFTAEKAYDPEQVYGKK